MKEKLGNEKISALYFCNKPSNIFKEILVLYHIMFREKLKSQTKLKSSFHFHKCGGFEALFQSKFRKFKIYLLWGFKLRGVLQHIWAHSLKTVLRFIEGWFHVQWA